MDKQINNQYRDILNAELFQKYLKTLQLRAPLRTEGLRSAIINNQNNNNNFIETRLHITIGKMKMAS